MRTRSLTTLTLACVLGYAPVLHSAPLHGPTVAAKVNGHIIYESDLVTTTPADSFADPAQSERDALLDRCINRIEVSEFLRAQKIEVPSREVEAAVAEVRATPPNMGCPCHRYPSLEAYFQANAYTLGEYKKDVRNDIGVTKYIDRLWDRTYPTRASRLALIEKERPQIEKDYVAVWHIFFNTSAFRAGDQDRLRATASRQAQAAWKRIQAGESFAAVAKSMSEDTVSRNAGGYMGITFKKTYGQVFANTLARLKPGQLSGPFESVYGFHIAKWSPIPDEDLIKVVRSNFKDENTSKTIDQIAASAKVVKFPS